MKGTLNTIDRIAGWLLLIGAILHAYGSYLAYPYLSSNLVWALSGSVAALPFVCHQPNAGQSSGRSAFSLDLFGRLPVMDWHRWRFCCDIAEPYRSESALPPHCHSDFDHVQLANCLGISDALITSGLRTNARRKRGEMTQRKFRLSDLRRSRGANVRYWPLADFPSVVSNARFNPGGLDRQSFQYSPARTRVESLCYPAHPSLFVD